MSTPRRLQRLRAAGWRKPEGAIYVGRPTRYGNPFRIGSLVADPGWWNRAACPYSGVLAAGQYTGHDIANRPYAYEIRPVRDAADATRLFAEYIACHDDEWDPAVIRQALGGRDLLCWCPLPEPGQPDHCHAAVLLELCRQDHGGSDAASS